MERKTKSRGGGMVDSRAIKERGQPAKTAYGSMAQEVSKGGQNGR